MMSDDVGRRGRKSTRRPRAAEVALAVALSAWIGGMAGALESLVRAVEHGHYFNTLSSYLSFVAVPALLYSIVGALVGALSAVLLRLLSGRSSAPASAAALSAFLVVFYWGSVFDEPVFSTAGNVAGHFGMVAAGIAVLVLVRRLLTDALRDPQRARRFATAAAVASIAALFLVTAGAWSWSSSTGRWGSRYPPAPEVPDESLNVLFFTLDTTRADHLGCYRYPVERSPRADGLGTSPTLDALASRGVVFENAVVPEVVTDPSHASMMTSLHPLEHGVTVNGQRLASEFQTLAELLSGAGYSTAAAVSVAHLDGYMSGLSQGFQDYYDRGFHDRFRYHTGWRGMPGWWKEHAFAHTRAADGALQDAEAWLRAHGGEPFFLWVHVFEPHMPYESHEVAGDVFSHEDANEIRNSEGPAPERPVRLYDSEIRYADDALGHLLSLLDELGVSERTIVVAVGDHGEHMDEEHAGREWWFSHAGVYEEVCRVPLVLVVPPAASPWSMSGSAVHELVSTMDLGPTLLSALGVPETRAGVLGRDLTPLLSGEEWEERPEVVLANPHAEPDTRALRCARWKLMTSPEEGYRLFDLAADPLETVNLAHEYPSVLDSLRALLDAITATWSEPERQPSLDPEAREMLRALGYVN